MLLRPYLYHRVNKTSYDLTGYDLAAATAQVLLLRHSATPRTFTVAGPDLKPLRTLELAADEHVAPRLSPDGRAIIYNPWPWGQTPRTGPLLHLVSVATGATTAIPVPADLPAGTIAGVHLETLPGLFAVWLQLLRDGQPAWAIYRFDWAGGQTAALTGSGTLESASFSTDGSRVAIRQVLNGFASATAVYDLNSGKPLFRVLGAFPAGWLADGSHLLAEGPKRYHLIRSDGRLLDSPLSALGAGPNRLLPSPAAPNLIAQLPTIPRKEEAPTIHDLKGRTVHQAPIPPGHWLRGQWSPDGQELVFSFWKPGPKGGWYGDPFMLPPAVDFPPFEPDWYLEVRDPAGDCLHLRAEPAPTARSLRCLPTGTLLAVGDWARIREKGGPVENLMDYLGDPWLYVRTQQNESGWVALFTGSVQWRLNRR